MVLEIAFSLVFYLTFADLLGMSLEGTNCEAGDLRQETHKPNVLTGGCWLSWDCQNPSSCLPHYLPHAATSSLSIIHSGLEISESLIEGILFLWRAQSFIFATLQQLKFFSFRLSLGTTVAKE